MFGFKIDQAKKLFFDSPAVIAAVDKTTRKALSKFGAYVRRTAQQSLRSSKSLSKPGRPPNSHTKELRKGILFFFDPGAMSVIIGPTKYNVKVGDAPRALEVGGRSEVQSRSRRKPKRRTIEIKPRPYMLPAFEKVRRESLAKIWAEARG